ncbi:hypothetical protein BHM03_00041570 [Ensete ventricosum]|uniref:Flavin-containing monooxygenase n=1 Tax=Ensete ventricosum TaxID=4639 RepID=A0A445MKE5_ENSVE|nr:hypothetical protein BHM03_00041570 [Ensete ventricosum]
MSGETPLPATDPRSSPTRRISIVHGPVIVGAGPSGLAVAASLRRLCVPSVILERSDGIADLWSHRMYDRLTLHLPKPFCQLPHLPFPAHFPTYPSKDHFLGYLQAYAHHFSLRPLLGCTVVDARFDPSVSLWRVTAIRRDLSDVPMQALSPSRTSDSLSESSRSTSSVSSETPREPEVVEFLSPWLVVATGENAEPVVPELKGAEGFEGSLLHSSEYKSGVEYEGKRVLVVGCGNSGMEICVDLCEHGAMPFMSVRSGVRFRFLCSFSEGFGLFDCFGGLRCMHVHLMNQDSATLDAVFLVKAGAHLAEGDAGNLHVRDTEKYGLKRPKVGPLELKNTTGKTPVLDVGALSLIRDERIKIVSEVESLTSDGARFVDGGEMAFHAVVFATGYKSNVPLWLKAINNLLLLLLFPTPSLDSIHLFRSCFKKPRWPYLKEQKNCTDAGGVLTAEGKPEEHPFPNGEKGIYFVGFSGKGLLGASVDAIKTALDVSARWTRLSETKDVVGL